MRILHLTRDYPPASCGGTSTAVGNLVRALEGDSVTSAVISFDRWRTRERGEARFQIPGSGEVVLRVMSGSPTAEILSQASHFRPSLIHVHHENLWPSAEALRTQLSCPVVYTTHVLQLNRGKEGTASASDQRRALQECDLVIAPSYSAAIEIRTAGETAARTASKDPKVVVVPNVVAPALRRSRTPGLRKRALYVGRFDYDKGTDNLFDAIHTILNRDRRIQFDIAGGCPANPKSERRWRRRCDKTLGPELIPRVEFHGWLDDQTLAALYAEAFVQVVPSRHETFGLSAAEGMAAALPIVATRAPALAELVTDRETGLIAEVEDHEGVAGLVMELLERPQLARELGDNAARSIEERYSAPVISARMRAAYTTAS